MPDHVLVHVVAGAVLKKDGKFLLLQEAKESVRGQWNLPAGKVDEGETIEQAAIREVKEESGYDVELVRKIGIYQSNAKGPPRHAFEGRIVGGELHVTEGILDAKWLTLEEIEVMKDQLRGDWVLEAIKSA